MDEELNNDLLSLWDKYKLAETISDKGPSVEASPEPFKLGDNWQSEYAAKHIPDKNYKEHFEGFGRQYITDYYDVNLENTNNALIDSDALGTFVTFPKVAEIIPTLDRSLPKYWESFGDLSRKAKDAFLQGPAMVEYRTNRFFHGDPIAFLPRWEYTNFQNLADANGKIKDFIASRITPSLNQIDDLRAKRQEILWQARKLRKRSEEFRNLMVDRRNLLKDIVNIEESIPKAYYNFMWSPLGKMALANNTSTNELARPNDKVIRDALSREAFAHERPTPTLVSKKPISFKRRSIRTPRGK